MHIMESAVKAAAEHDRQEQVFALQRLEEEVQKNQDYVCVDTHVDYQMREIKDMVMGGKATDGFLRLRKLAEKYVYLPEESTAEKKRKQDLKDPRHPIEITAEPVIPIREPNTSQQAALDIGKDTDSAAEAIEGTREGEVSKEAACIEVELVEAKIQKCEKLDDLNTTQEKCKKAHEVGDLESQVEAIQDQESSITEEEVFLKSQKDGYADIREKVTALIESTQNN